MSSYSRKAAIASLIMMASIFLSRIIGIVRECVIANFQGAGSMVDAYQVAFELPEILNHVLATGFLSITFIPILSRYLADNDSSGAEDSFSAIFTLFGGTLAILTLFGCLGAQWIVPLLAPGYAGSPVMTHAVNMTRIVLPAQIFFFAGGMFMAVQFANERFLIPAMAPLIYNIGIILGGVCLAPAYGMYGFSWGALAGAFLGNFLIQWIGARRTGIRLKFLFAPHHPDIKAYFFLTLPLALGISMIFSTEILFKFFGSYLPSGGIASINYSMRIMMALVAFFGQAIGVATYPFLSRLAAEGNIRELNRIWSQALSNLVIVIPMAALFMVLRHEIVVILLRHGAFGDKAVTLTETALFFLLFGAAGFATQTVVVRGFYALQNTLFPAVYTSAAVLCSLPFYIAGVRYGGIRGLTLVISVSALIQVIGLFLIWNLRTRNEWAPAVSIRYGKAFLISIALYAAAAGVRRFLLPFFPDDSRTDALVIALITGCAYVPLQIAAGYLFRLPELYGFLILLFKKLFNPKNGSSKA